MDAIEFIKEYSRLCNTYKNCTECPFRETPCGTDCEWTLGLEEEIVAIVEEWSQAHPQKTMMQDFFEKFPNAPKREDGTPCACPAHLGYVKGNDGRDCECELFDYICTECWNRPLEE